jgi:Mce-associated membrane protein
VHDPGAAAEGAFARQGDDELTDSTPAETVAPAEVGEQSSRQAPAETAGPQRSTGEKTAALRSALVVGAVVMVALGGLAGWLGYRVQATRAAAQQRELFVQVGRQAAINLTTISYTEADADVARILDSATGAFHDDFQKRSQPFVDVIKKSQSTTGGSVTAAGLQYIAGDHAQVVVAVSVKTSNAGVPEQEPRGWRLRLDVQKVGDTAKVSDVQFVP